MKIRTILALTMALLMTILAGCGGTGATSAQTPAASSAAAPSAAAPASDSPLSGPIDLNLASQGTGTDDYITTALEAQFFQQGLPAGSNVIHETISSGCSSMGYLLEAGLSEFGTGQNAMSATVGMEGKPAYTKVSGLMATRKYAFVVQLVNNDFIKKTGYKSLREIIENKYPARICAEPIGSSDYVSFMYMMDALGTTVEEFEGWGGTITYTGGSACCDMLQDGQADIMIAHTTEASSSIVELCMSSDVQAFSLDEELIQALVDRGYARNDIPAGTFDRFDAATPSVCQASSKIVSTDMPDDIAYALTKILCENKEALGQDLSGYRDLTYKEIIDTEAMVVPMHPGAIKYFQDLGVLDANGKYVGEPKA